MGPGYFAAGAAGGTGAAAGGAGDPALGGPAREVHLRGGLGRLGDLEVFRPFGMGEGVDDAAHRPADGGVERLDCIVVALPLDGDAVLGAFQLVLELEEALVGLEHRIILLQHEQPAERRLTELAACALSFTDLAWK